MPKRTYDDMMEIDDTPTSPHPEDDPSDDEGGCDAPDDEGGCDCSDGECDCANYTIDDNHWLVRLTKKSEPASQEEIAAMSTLLSTIDPNDTDAVINAIRGSVAARIAANFPSR